MACSSGLLGFPDIVCIKLAITATILTSGRRLAPVHLAPLAGDLPAGHVHVELDGGLVGEDQIPHATMDYQTPSFL